MSSIFTKILAGELPGHFVWKDELCFAIMTIQPIRRGHLIVIPNQEVDHWDDVPPATAAHLMTVCQQITKGLKAVVSSKRVGMSVVGLEVPHTHIHLIPIDTMSNMEFRFAKPAATEELVETAAAIRAALVAQGHAQADL
ncbi:MAG TPA: HIT family protein [Hyphomicrobiales bacterium]|nr:HIT family protein [Hyphomicrobiales bacterium]